MKRALLIVLLVVVPLAAQEVTTKVIQVKHRPAEALARLIKAVSASASRDFNTITLVGGEAQMKAAEAIIQEYDTPRRQAEFLLRVIEASSLAQGPNDAADLVPAELKNLLRYTRFGLRDSVVVRGLETERLVIVLGGGLNGNIQFWLNKSDPTLIDVLVRIEGVFRDGNGKVSSTSTLLETQAAVKSGETVVLGASKMQGGPNALIVLLTAKLLP